MRESLPRNQIRTHHKVGAKTSPPWKTNRHTGETEEMKRKYQRCAIGYHAGAGYTVIGRIGKDWSRLGRHYKTKTKAKKVLKGLRKRRVCPGKRWGMIKQHFWELLFASVLGLEMPLHLQATFNPSIFTFEKFGVRLGDAQDRESLEKGLNVALAFNALFSGALLGIFHFARKDLGGWRYIPGILASSASTGVYLYYKNLMNQASTQNFLSQQTGIF